MTDPVPDDLSKLPAVEAVEDNSFTGAVIEDKYRLLEKLGTGSYSVVYKALDLTLDREQAVKILHQHTLNLEGARNRFLQESLTIASLNHPGIVKIYSKGALENGQLYIVMDYINGKTLASILAAEKTLQPQALFSIFDQVLNALAYAHQNGVIHRDLKPENIMLSSDGKASILDFGIAKNLLPVTSLVHTTTGVHLGTSNYMSPEQCTAAAVDARSDLYSLACVIYECVIGAAPFAAASDMEVMYKQVHKSITQSHKLDGMPKGLRAVLARAMQKEPSARFQSADEMRAALRACEDEVNVPASTEMFRKFAVIALLLTVSAGFLSIVFQNHKPKPNTSLQHEPKLPRAAIKTRHDVSALMAQYAVSIDEKIEKIRNWLDEERRKPGAKARENYVRASVEFSEFLVNNQHEQEAYDVLAPVLDWDWNVREKAVNAEAMANLQAKLGQYEQSIASCRKAISLAGDNEVMKRSCLKRIANAYVFQSKFSEAEKLALAGYNPSAPLTPEKLEDVLQLSSIYVQEKKFNDAIKLLLPYVDLLKKMEPSDEQLLRKKSDVFVMLGEAYWYSGHPDVGEKYFHRAIAIFAERRPEIQSLLVKLYISTGRVEKAEATQEQIVPFITPKQGCRHYIEQSAALAEIYHALKKFSAAQEQLLKSLDTWARLGDHSSERMADYLTIQVHLLRPLFNCYWEREQYSEYEQLTSHYLKNLSGKSFLKAALLENLGRAFCYEGRAEDAIKSFNDALESLPADSEFVKLQIQLEKAQWLYFFGKVDDADRILKPIAKELFEQYPNNYPECSQAREIEGQIASARGQSKKAILATQLAINLAVKAHSSPANLARMWGALGTLYMDSKNYQLASVVFERAAQIQLSSGITENLGLAVYRTKRLLCLARIKQPITAAQLTAVELAIKQAVQYADERHIELREHEQMQELLKFLPELKAYTDLQKPATALDNGASPVGNQIEKIQKLLK